MPVDDSIDQGDLKRVKGIGATIEARLKGAGITSLARLARTPVNELAAILEGLHSKYDADRITREEWLSQAAALASGPAAATEAEPAKRVRHNFTVEIQLAIEGRKIVSSKIVHVQTGDEATWGGWDGHRIVAFIEDRAGTRSAGVVTELKESTLPTEPAVRTDLRLHSFAMVDASGPAAARTGSLTATLSFDASTAGLPSGRLARAQVDVYARRPALAKSLLVGSAAADISPDEQVAVQVPSRLPAISPLGNLFAVVRLFAASEAGRKPSSILPNARLTVSQTADVEPGKPI
jgi:hypothetical protein